MDTVRLDSGLVSLRYQDTDIGEYTDDDIIDMLQCVVMFGEKSRIATIQYFPSATIIFKTTTLMFEDPNKMRYDVMELIPRYYPYGLTLDSSIGIHRTTPYSVTVEKTISIGQHSKTMFIHICGNSWYPKPTAVSIVSDNLVIIRVSRGNDFIDLKIHPTGHKSIVLHASHYYHIHYLSKFLSRETGIKRKRIKAVIRCAIDGIDTTKMTLEKLY